jgi:hypothetical protein
MEGKEPTSQPLGAHSMTETIKDILQDLAKHGHAVIRNHSIRELNAAQDLIDAGICYRSNTLVGYFIIKFGSKENQS